MDRTITLIRHGKTSGNREKRYVGITDEALSSEGELEIKTRAYPKADIVFSSPMMRCLETAKIIYPDQEPIVIPELRETDFGRFEGKNYLERLAAQPKLAGEMLFQDWADLWYESIKGQVSESTYKLYTKAMRHLAKQPEPDWSRE